MTELNVVGKGRLLYKQRRFRGEAGTDNDSPAPSGNLCGRSCGSGCVLRAARMSQSGKSAEL